MTQIETNTRDKVLRLLRRKQMTAEQIASELAITPAGVRSHLGKLEGEGIIVRVARRKQGVGQPSILYQISAQAEDAFSHAYKPMLIQLLDILPDTISEKELVELMRETGRRLAEKEPVISGELRKKVEESAKTLDALGALIELEDIQDGIQLTSYSCPLADAVRCRPEVCQAVTAFLEETTSCKVFEKCEREQAPLKCEFIISRKSIGTA